MLDDKGVVSQLPTEIGHICITQSSLSTCTKRLKRGCSSSNCRAFHDASELSPELMCTLWMSDRPHVWGLQSWRPQIFDRSMFLFLALWLDNFETPEFLHIPMSTSWYLKFPVERWYVSQNGIISQRIGMNITECSKPLQERNDIILLCLLRAF